MKRHWLTFKVFLADIKAGKYTWRDEWHYWVAMVWALLGTLRIARDVKKFQRYCRKHKLELDDKD